MQNPERAGFVSDVIVIVLMIVQIAIMMLS